MVAKNFRTLLWRSLSLLSRQDQQKIYMIAILQTGMAFLDMLSIAIIGFVASLSLFGIQSQEFPQSITRVLEFFYLDDLTFQHQVAILGAIAGVLLVGKTFFSAYLFRRILFFLNLKTALITAEMLGRVLDQPFDYVKSKSPAEILFSLTRGVQSLVTGIIGSASLVFNEIALICIVFAGLLFFDPVITIFAFLYFGLIGYLQSKRLHKSAEFSQSESAQALIRSESQILESFSLYRELHVRGSRRIQISQISKNRERMASFNSRVLFMPYVAKYSMEISLVLGAMILMATQLIIKDAFSALTTLSVFLVAASRVSPSILRLQQGLIQLRASTGDSQRTLQLLRKLEKFEKSSKSGAPSKSITQDGCGILVSNLIFRYQDGHKDTIKDISFKVLPGSTLALVGPSGNGKSTILDLLMGALKPQRGSVKIWGLPPAEFILRCPGQLGYVAQESIFANASIKENLLLGLDPDQYSEQDIWEVLERVGLKSAIKELSEGLDSSIGERGLKLSSGQKQRLSIARAIITNPKVLFLDEPTSSLDKDSENLITELIDSLKGKTTVVVIAHRLETIKKADQIAFIEGGKVKAIGNYDEIFSQNLEL